MSNRKTKSLSRREFGGMAVGATALGTAAQSQAQADARPALRILCYNIHWCKGNDGVYDVPRVAEVIKASKPDLVALQEIDVNCERSGRRHEIRMLAEETGMAARFGPTQHWEGGLFGNGVLSKLPIHDVHIQPLPYTESTEELKTYPRGAVAAVVELETGQKVRFISTHFQHNVPEDRVAEAKAINGHFAADDPASDTMGAEAAALPTILAGDLNAKPGDEPITELQKKWTFALEDEPAPTAPSKDPRSRIDYILHRSSDPFRIVEHYVVDEPMASDHCPVFAVLELKG